jgi:hypothetical protein
LRQGGAILRTLSGRAGRLADSLSSSQGRRARRHARRWLETHGLTIVLVSGMMVVAWLIAAHWTSVSAARIVPKPSRRKKIWPKASGWCRRAGSAFCLEILDLYFKDVRAMIQRTLRNDSLAPLERLRAFVDAQIEYLNRIGWRNGCLIGNFSAEASEQGEVTRKRLVEIYEEMRQVGRVLLESRGEDWRGAA